MVLHWDSKLLPTLCGAEKKDRLPIIVTFQGKEKLLEISEIPAATGQDQATAVFQTVQKWGIEENIQALCFDTTASNTGRINGACTKLEEMFERDLLYLPCKHHICEFNVKKCF